MIDPLIKLSLDTALYLTCSPFSDVTLKIGRHLMSSSLSTSILYVVFTLESEITGMKTKKYIKLGEDI